MKITGHLLVKIPIEAEVPVDAPNGTYPDQARMQFAKRAEELRDALVGTTGLMRGEGITFKVHEEDWEYTAEEDALFAAHDEQQRLERRKYDDVLKAQLVERGATLRYAVESFVDGVYNGNIPKAIETLSKPYFEGKVKLLNEGWDKSAISDVLEDPYVADLLIAFDDLIVRTEDTHHVFLEGFTWVAEEDGVQILKVITGS